MLIKLTKIIIFTFIFTSISVLASAPSNQQKHLSESGGYSINFSGQWEVIKGSMGIDVIALAQALAPDDLFRENINVIHDIFNFPITREEYYEYNIDSLSKLLEDFDLEEALDVKLDGVDAKKLVFTHTVGVVHAKVIQYLILDENRAYIMTFTADPIDFKRFRPQFEEIANSVKFLNHSSG